MNDISPFEKMHNITLDYDMMKSFRCLAYVSTLYRNRSKFDNKADKGIFLGYATGMKGFKIYNLESHKVQV